MKRREFCKTAVAAGTLASPPMSQALAAALAGMGYRLCSGGTDNHLMLIDVTVKKFNGKEVQAILDRVRITVNKNMIPFDTQKPFVTSGIRIGTPALSSRGMGADEMKLIAGFIAVPKVEFRNG
ncbi:MAG: hypothetical protein IIA76_02605 [Proteobacteria bacterium]|nr:hypothetical protein [Pseudomonadota bacterium]